MKEKTVQYYPVFLNLTGRKCVVVGGGKVAERKVRRLLKTGARITVISPEITLGLEKLNAGGKIRHKNRPYRRGDTRGAFLVIAATSDDVINRKIASESEGLVNVADKPELCGFIAPSVVNRGALIIAISTSGVSPALAKTLRKELEKLLPADVAGYLELLKRLRQRIKELFPSSPERAALLKELGSPEMLDILRKKGLKQAKATLEKMMSFRSSCLP
jgi:precorrin-2 dehydrogenase / sirohydrochlorin ferrochelatase